MQTSEWSVHVAAFVWIKRVPQRLKQDISPINLWAASSHPFKMHFSTHSFPVTGWPRARKHVCVPMVKDGSKHGFHMSCKTQTCSTMNERLMKTGGNLLFLSGTKQKRFIRVNLQPNHLTLWQMCDFLLHVTACCCCCFFFFISGRIVSERCCCCCCNYSLLIFYSSWRYF